jgi:DeoR family transcriptional regulator, suf operon transcriptional repressor
VTPATRGASRDRVLALLRQGPATIEQIVTALGLSRGAVRLQLTALERDGLIARRGLYRGPTKPSATYEITSRGQVSLSRAYVPMLTRLLHVLSVRLGPEEFDGILREVGRSMLEGRERPSGALGERVWRASALFNEMGGLTTVDGHDGTWLIRSHGCPFAATTERHPEACSAVESLLAEFIGAPVRSRCERNAHMRCCFSVSAQDSRDAGAADVVPPT